MTEERISKDGAFVVYYNGDKADWKNIEVFLGRRYDGFYELLGGGFDISDMVPSIAVCREFAEETSDGIILNPNEVEYFCHMIQRVPAHQNEKGHAFYFAKERNGTCMDFCAPSDEHTDLSWHKLENVFRDGDTKYKTATLRVLVKFVEYLNKKQFIFGILGQKVSLNGYTF